MTSALSEPNYQPTHLAFNDEWLPNFLEDSERTMINQQLLRILEVKFRVARMKAIAHKTTARFWGNVDLWLNLPNTALAAISGASALSNPTGNSQIIVGILGLTVALLTSINTFLKPSKRSNDHVQFAARYNALRNQIDWFRSLKCVKEPEGENQYRPIKEKDNDLTQEVHTLFKEVITEFNELSIKAPILPKWASDYAEKLAG